MSEQPTREHKLTVPEVENFIARQIQADAKFGGDRTQRMKCRSCPAMIYMAPHPNTGNRAPWDVDGKSHFSTCPAAKAFRKPKKVSDV